MVTPLLCVNDWSSEDLGELLKVCQILTIPLPKEAAAWYCGEGLEFVAEGAAVVVALVAVVIAADDVVDDARLSSVLVGSNDDPFGLVVALSSDFIRFERLAFRLSNLVTAITLSLKLLDSDGRECCL